MPQLTNQQAQRALVALTEESQKQRPAKAALRIGRLVIALEDAVKLTEKVRLDSLRHFAKLNEAGEMTIEGGSVVFRDPAALAEFNRFYQDLMEATVEIKPTVTLENFGEELKGALVAALGDLLDETTE